MGFHMPMWGFYTIDRRRRRVPEDEDCCSYFGFSILEGEKDKWRLVDKPIREILKEAFGPRYSPIWYFIGTRFRQGLFD